MGARPVDRPEYIAALQQSQSDGCTEAFGLLLYQRLGATLQEYPFAAQEAIPAVR
jgi:hypothetical protein